MKLVTEQISLEELHEMAKKMFGDLVKAVVDIEQGIMVVDAALHSDQEEFLLEREAVQPNLWGINLHPNKPVQEWIEFDSMINLRPSSGNRSRFVEDPIVREKIVAIVNKLVAR